MLTEIYLIGDTAALQVEDMESLPCVDRVVRVSEEYRVLGRHHDDHRPTWFEYNGVRFGQDNLNVFAGLCAVLAAMIDRQFLRAAAYLGISAACIAVGIMHSPLPGAPLAPAAIPPLAAAALGAAADGAVRVDDGSQDFGPAQINTDTHCYGSTNFVSA